MKKSIQLIAARQLKENKREDNFNPFFIFNKP
jgi:hypothetical protein